MAARPPVRIDTFLQTNHRLALQSTAISHRMQSTHTTNNDRAHRAPTPPHIHHHHHTYINYRPPTHVPKHQARTHHIREGDDVLSIIPLRAGGVRRVCFATTPLQRPAHASERASVAPQGGALPSNEKWRRQVKGKRSNNRSTLLTHTHTYIYICICICIYMYINK